MDQTPQEALKNLVFAKSLVQQPEVVRYFGVLDELCIQTVHLIMQHTDFVEWHLLDTVAEVAGNLTHGRTVFVKDSNEDIEFGPYKSESEVLFLENSVSLFNLFSAKKPNKDKVRQAIADGRFARLVYEGIITKFIDKTEGYCSLANEYTRLHCTLDRVPEEQAHRIAVSLADIHDQMEPIEESVDVSREELYHLSRAVREFWNRYLSVREKIIHPYMRVAYKEARYRATTEEQVVENFQNGVQGLIRAVSCYNQNRMINFSSYSRWWVRQSILLRLKEDSNLVKLPATTWQAHTSIQRARNKTVTENESELEEEVVSETGLSKEKVRSIQDAVRTSQMFSLDHPIDDNESTLSQILGVDHQFTRDENEVEVRARLRRLTDRQRVILALRFGIFDLLEDRAQITDEEKFLEMVRQKVTQNRLS